ncbi:hydrogenase maturation protease [Methylocella silvestris BL2]|uniref:Hydrogenase maturation protease n=1 Tax=Methylocella silvestris (strain DSM 15510 / CIP 108128 / LMG 27833 / NCIMB 13906 / BL2) TaxID=395965 RepID=B8EJF0_METSB|nr:hydrogenase maturation protease [Methylocella silvestris]ACK52642.1 hydrogenase maturation protease [Methylocella silvestris BL2]
MIAIIGCGNANRRDDGVGPEVIHALRARGLESAGVKLFDAGTDGMAVMFAARGCAALIIVDAANSGSEPGALYEVPGHELERPYTPSLNLHDFRWDAALHAGRQIFRDAFPQDVTVFLIEAQELGLGIGLSPAVAAAADKVAQRIEALIGARVEQFQT